MSYFLAQDPLEKYFHSYLNDIKFKPSVIPNFVIVNIYRQDFDGVVKNTDDLREYFDKIFSDLNNLDFSYIIFTLTVGETTQPGYTNPACQEILRLVERLKSKVKNYCILLNTTVNELFYPEDANIVVLPWCLMSTVAWFSYSKVFYNWQPQNEKILFLPGKLEKANRLPVIYHLLNSKYSDRITYSCDPNFYNYYNDDHYYSTLSVLMTETTDKEWDIDSVKKYIQSVSRSLDFDENLLNNLHVVPTELYQNIKLEIIPETSLGMLDHLSEKSFRPIVLGFPFLHVNRAFKKSLGKLGFKTFDEVLTDYDEHYSHKEFINQLMIDLDSLDNSINSSPQAIANIIEHNKNTAQQVYQQYVNEIKNFIPSFSQFDQLFFTQYLKYSPIIGKSLPSLSHLYEEQ